MMKKIFTHKPVALDYENLLCETAETGRTYETPKGKKYPSITTVLGVLSEDSIRAWRARVGEEEANRISARACRRGESVHTLVERLIKNEEVSVADNMPNVWMSFSSIRRVIEEHIDNIVLQEKPLYSDHLGVAGRVDLIAEYDGKLSIIDIKTSTRIKEHEDIHSYFMQESAYAIMFEERTGRPVTQLVTIMAVDNELPLVFKEHRDNWTKPLIETIAEYRRRKLFGHI